MIRPGVKEIDDRPAMIIISAKAIERLDKFRDSMRKDKRYRFPEYSEAIEELLNRVGENKYQK